MSRHLKVLPKRSLAPAALAALALVAASCGGFPGTSASAVPPDGAAPASTDTGAATTGAEKAANALDGTITYTLDAATNSAGSTSESHVHLSVDVHLRRSDEPNAFTDAGSTFTYSDTNVQNDPKTVSSCGMHVESSGSGGGSFAPKGSISAWYGDNSPTASLTIHAPYSSAGTSTFLCNGLTDSGTTDELTQTECDMGGTGELDGTIQPGNVTKIAVGQVIDFECNQSSLGTTITVTGSLTSS